MRWKVLYKYKLLCDGRCFIKTDYYHFMVFYVIVFRQLLVRHYKVYYPVRHHLIQHMVSSIQKLGFTPNATIEHRRLAVDLAEVIMKWEAQRIKEDGEVSKDVSLLINSFKSITGH